MSWEEMDETEEVLDVAFGYLEPKEWMEEVDRVVDAYKHEVDMLRKQNRTLARQFLTLEKKVDTLSTEFTPIRKAITETK